MSKAVSLPIPPAETSPRRSLRWGGGVLVVGLGLVGVGAADEGAVFALLGLLLTIYGIHTYGRLGPEDDERPEAERRADAKRRASTDAFWHGLLAIVAGIAIVLGNQFSSTPEDPSRHPIALLVVVAGLIRAAQGWSGLRARPAETDETAPSSPPGGEAEGESKPGRVARRRRLDKHPAP